MRNGSVSVRGKLEYWIYSYIKSLTKIIIVNQFVDVKIGVFLGSNLVLALAKSSRNWYPRNAWVHGVPLSYRTKLFCS